MDTVRRIADAVLYEGYLLWPYRRSAAKNQQRWTFGGVYPEAYSRAVGSGDPWTMQTECLVRGPGAVDMWVRFLHVIRRQVARRGVAGLEDVDALEVAGTRYLSWEEATEREVRTSGLPVAALAAQPRRLSISVPAGRAVEPLGDAGVVRRRWHALRGQIELRAAPLSPDLHRLTVTIANTTPWSGASRAEALGRTFVSAHTVLRVESGEFLSLMDPPDDVRAHAAGCRNVGTWPVLVGAEGERRMILSSPIVLYDYPRIAPESPGDLFDATEMDQLLTLNILTLTDEERREIRGSDPRAREILDRTAALTAEELLRLHGAVREFRLLRERRQPGRGPGLRREHRGERET